MTDDPALRLAGGGSTAARSSKWLSRALALVLLVFHGWLLATQWMAGRFTEPGLLLRWAGAIALGIALTSFYRSGISLVSRKSLVIWLLAALLHGPAVASRIGADIGLAGLPEAAISVVLQTAKIAGALALAALLITAFFRRRTFTAPLSTKFASIVLDLTLLSDGYCAVISARPPPAQL